MKKVGLIVVAHPDDEVLGCGGTVAKLSREGWEFYTLFLGEGVTSRDEKRDLEKRKTELLELQKNALRANEILGVKEVFFEALPDNRFDGIELLDIVKRVEFYIQKVKPKIVFTHWEKDLNQDHRLVAKAVKIATRPLPHHPVKAVYSCEVLSSSEWNFLESFTPNVYVDITQTLEKKLKAMEQYKGELREFPHPRSLKGIEIKAAQRGMEVGLPFAEAFKVIREIKETF